METSRNIETRSRTPEVRGARDALLLLRDEARLCVNCPLYENATQTVFGAGPVTARLILVGEQPGDVEDRKGEPFVGPAGRVLDQGLDAAGIDRGDVYVTNVVKHFSWVQRGKRRLHKKPTLREVSACIPWLEREIDLIRPDVLVCLGSTSAQALFGRDFRVTAQRGQLLETRLSARTLATVHPSSILRQRTSEARHREMERFAEDLRVARAALRRRR